MEFDENCTDCSPTLSEDGVKEFFLLAPTPLIWRGVVKVIFCRFRSKVNFLSGVN
jgi:hypothetical protein